jgi:glycosyltransferase involved in cell wall biosynthesis
MSQTASIIICTRNRATSLLKTLDSLKKISIPRNAQIELLVIDNGSTDDTTEIVKECSIPQINSRCICEDNLGVSYARNRGLAEAKGEIVLFIDDDVRPTEEWMVNILTYFDHRNVDAVAGKVTLPVESLRPWMTKLHRTRLASTEGINPEKPAEMIGANMAFKRHVLDRVPRFDIALGPGALGFGEDSLFSQQLLEAGYQIAFANDAVVEHRFGVQRLSRLEWLSSAVKRGNTKAYIHHHWEHKEIQNPHYKYLREIFNLNYWRANHREDCRLVEGCVVEEMQRVRRAAFYKQYLIEKRRPRNFEVHGLVKIH